MTSPASAVQSSGKGTFGFYAINEFRESAKNPRKHFDPKKLAELTASVRQSGVLTPVTARVISTYPPVFELAAGHRRYRAAKAAGLDELPAVVRTMTDEEFLEILNVENLQRDDIHPLEEADGYRTMLTLDGYDVPKLAGKVGKSESYVYDRLKLLALTKEAKTLFLDGAFTAGHAILLARLAPKDQTRCIATGQSANSYVTDVAGGMWEQVGHQHPALGLDEDIDGGITSKRGRRLKAVSVRELQAWIDNNVRFAAPDPSTPHLFAGTAENLAVAAQEKLKVIEISRDHHVREDAKHPDGRRTYCITSWKRADGQAEPPTAWHSNPAKSKPCDHSVLGVIVAGGGRGESFLVCINKQKCTTHWGAAIRERNRREKAREKVAARAGGKSDEAEPKEQPWERERRLREEREAKAAARWEKGRDAVLGAIAAGVKKLPTDSNGPAAKWLWERMEDGIYGLDDAAKESTKRGVARGSTAADFLRHLVLSALIAFLEDDYNREDVQDDLTALRIKVDIGKLLDAANPVPAKEKKPTPAKAKANGRK